MPRVRPAILPRRFACYGESIAREQLPGSDEDHRRPKKSPAEAGLHEIWNPGMARYLIS